MSQQQPPKLARKIFEWYCGPAQVDDLLGDMDEWFYKNLETKSVFTARLIYWKHMLQLLLSYAIRKRKKSADYSAYASASNSWSLFGNYLKVAVRNLYQYRYFSVLNAFGLAIGMSISLLLIAMYSYVSTYDNFHVNRHDIYSIATTRLENIEEIALASAPHVLGDELLAQYGNSYEIVRVHSAFMGQVKSDRENIPLQGYYADSNFLSVFTFPLLQGNATTALSKPNSIILTESAAQKIFGTHQVLGKVLEMEGLGSFEITGLMANHPANTHMEFEALASFNTLPVSTQTVESRWTDYANQYVYVRLHTGATIAELKQRLALLENDVYKQSPIKVNFNVLTMQELVFTDLRNSIGPQWELSGFVVFGVIALVILLPGCFNYTNISIARALKRSKEIGLRKTMGGARRQIFAQFLTETLVIVLISLIGSLLIFFLLRTEFQQMMVDASALDLSLTARMIWFFVVFALLVGLVTGLFPALYFAGLNPIQALKGKTTSKAFTATRLRKGLTIFQFALSFCFILSMVVFSRQYRTLINFDFGFDRENIVNVQLQEADPTLLKAELSKLAFVKGAALSSGSLGLSSSQTWLQHANTTDSLEVNQLFVDADYFPIFNLTLLAGEFFSEASERDQHLIVNEEFIKALSITTPQDALGKSFIANGRELTIIGVVKNFQYTPPGIPIGKFAFRMDPEQFTQVSIMVEVTDPYTVFSSIETTWKSFYPHQTCEASFLNDELNDSYLSYRLLLKMAGFLGLLAITISILGLLGMVVYTSETRIKEVGVRKVLGATVWTIVYLLSKDYLKLILWAVVAALPVAFFVFTYVLARIPDYQVSLNTVDVLISTFLLLLIGLATIGSQTAKTALANPAETLKYE